MVTDIHAHLFPQAYLERLTEIRGGPLDMSRDGENYRLAVGGHPFTRFTPDFYDADVRIEAMDRFGVATQVLTLAPPLVYWSDPGLATELCRMTNDHFAMLVQRHPGRFIAGAVVPLQDPDLALAELRRAVDDLGHEVVLLGSNIQGVQLDDPRLEPFYAEVERRGLPIFVHPIRPAGVECMHDYRLDLSVGFPGDTTLAAGRLILSGLLDRHPGLRFCWSHLGGSFLWLLDRIEMVRDSLPGSHSPAQHHISHYLNNYWFDTKVPALRNLEYGVGVAGYERFMFGTDAPFFGDKTPDVLSLIRAAPFLDDRQRDAVLSTNAQTFLKGGEDSST